MSEIPLSQPDITDAEIEAVTSVLRSGRLSIGPRQDLFEQLVAERAGRQHGIAVSSGTAGLHLAMLALGVGPGDEVITTPFSFIASANCILMAGAVPVFVDIDPQSMNLDPARLEAAITPKTKAIIAVEVFGNPRHMEKIEQIAQQHEIPLVEDACEGMGGICHGRPVGNFGRVSVFGFYPNKQVTTGEGGMIVTDDSRLAEACRSLRNQGRPSGNYQSHGTLNRGGVWLEHESLGYNYRLSEIAAGLGIAQMNRLDEMLDARRRVAGMYMRRLMDWDDLVIPTVEPNCEGDMSWFVYVVRLNSSYGKTERDRIITGMRRHEVGASNYFPCIHLQPFYRQQHGFKKGDYPIAESISERTIALPFFNKMDETQVELVCHTLKVMIQREQLLKR
ncbi:DegT/DnrJ/EryC1/StrS family aminotransferase [Phycisphaerales bacterium AB-hyl4]|uniref:DegT/DnrJ/EryC1/StrS family aminotransferase n=1 Tax=Natronomicrosphaera hydrolytica TaxID=3242702 RepID=A0ABV4TZA1_9BACT